MAYIGVPTTTPAPTTTTPTVTHLQQTCPTTDLLRALGLYLPLGTTRAKGDFLTTVSMRWGSCSLGKVSMIPGQLPLTTSLPVAPLPLGPTYSLLIITCLMNIRALNSELSLL